MHFQFFIYCWCLIECSIFYKFSVYKNFSFCFFFCFVSSIWCVIFFFLFSFGVCFVLRLTKRLLLLFLLLLLFILLLTSQEQYWFSYNVAWTFLPFVLNIQMDEKCASSILFSMYVWKRTVFSITFLYTTNVNRS